ncbi:ribose transport system permease protein [Sphaerochaeta associata]|uniref:ABC transporter permease n=1 Tax=Sphaerochaeta associata TaxID=1129264 RepID=A0ABY4D5R8_9SPIR|nr:ABC transporter permease [Sphaerochaeta associata]UOM49623.1 ABC transporter permease [Sphaerochaeta associata]SMP49095.1 ribose transport system permease protein [Sphaerochaeta associata]
MKQSLRKQRPDEGTPMMQKTALTASSRTITMHASLAKRLLLSEYFVLYLTILYILVLTPIIPRLWHPMNIQNILSNMWPLLVVAIGQTFVLILAGIDLSQTSVMAMSSVIGAVVMTSSADPILFTKSPLWGVLLSEQGGLLGASAFAVPVGILVMLAVGLFIGFLNGFSVAYFKMPPFIVTLVSMMLFSAMAIYLTKSENIRHLPQAYLQISKTKGSFISGSLIIALFLAIIAHIVLTRTLFGKRLYAVGINTTASEISGVPAKTTIIAAYMLSGACAAIAGVLYSSRLEMGRPTLGSTLFIDIVGANIIGGISLAGGKGKVTWTIFGVFFFIILANSLNMLNLSFYIIDMVKGSVILVAALLDVARNSIRKSQM